MQVRRPSPAMLVALAALFVALGGTSYAALQLPKGSVGTSQLKRNAVTSPKVKPGSLLLSDFKRAERSRLRGPQGPQGPQGQQGLQGPQGVQGNTGAPGTARAFGSFAAAGVPTSAARVKALTVRKPAATTGVYCLSSPAVAVADSIPVVSTDYSGPATQDTITMVRSAGVGCDADEWTVQAFQATTANPINTNFSVVIP
jgi:hypothetical protein